MTELAFTTLRLGYLLALWLLIGGVVLVIRRDIFGTVVTPRGKRAAGGRARRKPAAGMEASVLVVTEGPLTGSTLPLGEAAILIGRSPAATLVLDDEYVSGRHAQIFREADTWYVEDLGSTNGTVIAGSRITQPTALRIGQPVRIGQNMLELRG